MWNFCTYALSVCLKLEYLCQGSMIVILNLRKTTSFLGFIHPNHSLHILLFGMTIYSSSGLEGLQWSRDTMGGMIAVGNQLWKGWQWPKGIMVVAFGVATRLKCYVDTVVACRNAVLTANLQPFAVCRQNV